MAMKPLSHFDTDVSCETTDLFPNSPPLLCPSFVVCVKVKVSVTAVAQRANQISPIRIEYGKS